MGDGKMQWKKRVNVDKVKDTQLSFEKKCNVSKVDPCSVCGEQVSCNSIQCTKCQRWVHCCCFDVPGQVSLLSCRDVFVCRTCLGHNYSAEENLEFKRWRLKVLSSSSDHFRNIMWRLSWEFRAQKKNGCYHFWKHFIRAVAYRPENMTSV